MSVPVESERLALGMWTVFPRLPRIRQLFAWCLVSLRSTKICIYQEMESGVFPYFARLVHASVPEVFSHLFDILT